MKKVVFLLMALLLTTGFSMAQDQQRAIISAENAMHDFGVIKESAGKVTHVFVIKNDGTMPLVMTRVIASCGCSTPEWTKEPIAPGKTGQVKVTFNPEGRPGPFAKTISVYSNGRSGSFVLTIRGEVK